MTYITESRYPRAGIGTTGAPSGLGNLPLRISQTLNMWYDRTRQRRHLAQLDDRLLSDIGVDRATAMQEVSKPFWRG